MLGFKRMLEHNILINKKYEYKNNVIKILIKSILPKYCTIKQQKILQILKESNVFETIIQQHVLPRGHATFWHGSPWRQHYASMFSIALWASPFTRLQFRTHNFSDTATLCAEYISHTSQLIFILDFYLLSCQQTNTNIDASASYCVAKKVISKWGPWAWHILVRFPNHYFWSSQMGNGEPD